MNNLAVSPYFGIHALQIQNVKRDVAPILNISALQKQPVLEPPINENNIKENESIKPFINVSENVSANVNTNINTDINTEINTDTNTSTPIDMLAPTE